MKASMKISLFGTALLVLSAGTVMAQETGTRDSGREKGEGRNAQQNSAQGNTTTTTEIRSSTSGNNAQGARAGHDTQMLIGHAVSMAISGTTLKGQAEQAGKMDTPGQAGSQGNQTQAGAPGQPGSQGGHAMSAGGDHSQQLMMHARKEIQASQQLLQGAGRDQASAQQLYTAANGYINTLFAICGESSTTQDAGAARAGNAASEAGRAQTGRSSRDENLGAGQAGRQGSSLSARDKAAVALINHSVCEVIHGTSMTHMLHSQGAGNSAATELLQRHAREMTTEGRETLQRILGSSRTGTSGAGTSNSGDAARTGALVDSDQAKAVRDAAQAAGGDAAQAAGGQAGDASVMTLARRGQELIEAFQAGGQGGAQGDSGRPGGSRGERDGNPSGADRSSGAGRASDAETKTSPR